MTPEQLEELHQKPVDRGNRVAAACDVVGCTQMDCARGTGFTAQYVSDVARGRFKTLSVENAHKFAAFFGCAIEDLFPAREAVAS